MADNGSDRLTIGEVAKELGGEVWQIRRCISRGFLPATLAERLGNWRCFRRKHLPRIRKALTRAGYLRRAVGAA